MECQPTFEFVIQGPKSNGFSKETRTRIRRQAMKAVGAARRQSGRYGKHNQRQSPPELRQKTIDIALRLAPQACVVEEGKTGRKDTADASWPSDRTCSLTVPSPMPLSGIDAMVRDHGICPTDLSALTSAHIGRVASKILSSHSRMLVSLLSYPSWSYFSMIPGRFGYSSCLDDAVLCLMGKARILLAPSSKTSETLILSNYGKALQSLQSAVNNPALCTSADVLCATEVLALFEVSLKGTSPAIPQISLTSPSAPACPNIRCMAPAHRRSQQTSAAQGTGPVQNRLRKGFADSACRTNCKTFEQQ